MRKFQNSLAICILFFSLICNGSEFGVRKMPKLKKCTVYEFVGRLASTSDQHLLLSTYSPVGLHIKVDLGLRSKNNLKDLSYLLSNFVKVEASISDVKDSRNYVGIEKKILAWPLRVIATKEEELMPRELRSEKCDFP